MGGGLVLGGLTAPGIVVAATGAVIYWAIALATRFVDVREAPDLPIHGRTVEAGPSPHEIAGWDPEVRVPFGDD